MAERRITLSSTDRGNISMQVIDGDESRFAILSVEGGTANPVQVEVTPDAVSIQFTIDGKYSFVTATRKDGKVLP